MSKKCIIINCEEIISPRSQLEICPKCRATMGVWKKRSPAARLQRRSNLTRYADRMDNLIESSKPRLVRSSKRA